MLCLKKYFFGISLYLLPSLNYEEGVYNSQCQLSFKKTKKVNPNSKNKAMTKKALATLYDLGRGVF